MFFLHPENSGVCPWQSWAVRLAPRRERVTWTSVCPYWEARWRGVLLQLSLLSISAQLSSTKFTISLLPAEATKWRGVLPALFLSLMMLQFPSKSHKAVALSPFTIACCSFFRLSSSDNTFATTTFSQSNMGSATFINTSARVPFDFLASDIASMTVLFRNPANFLFRNPSIVACPMSMPTSPFCLLIFVFFFSILLFISFNLSKAFLRCFVAARSFKGFPDVFKNHVNPNTTASSPNSAAVSKLGFSQKFIVELIKSPPAWAISIIPVNCHAFLTPKCKSFNVAGANLFVLTRDGSILYVK